MDKKKHENFDLDLLDELNAVASATECTGLFRLPPTNEDEAESYGRIYVVPEQVNDFSKVKKPRGRHIKPAPDM